MNGVTGVKLAIHRISKDVSLGRVTSVVPGGVTKKKTMQQRWRSSGSWERKLRNPGPVTGFR